MVLLHECYFFFSVYELTSGPCITLSQVLKNNLEIFADTK